MKPSRHWYQETSCCRLHFFYWKLATQIQDVKCPVHRTTKLQICGESAQLHLKLAKNVEAKRVFNAIWLRFDWAQNRNSADHRVADLHRTKKRLPTPKRWPNLKLQLELCGITSSTSCVKNRLKTLGHREMVGILFDSPMNASARRRPMSWLQASNASENELSIVSSLTKNGLNQSNGKLYQSSQVEIFWAERWCLMCRPVCPGFCTCIVI